MPVYVLDGSGRVSLPRRALAITADAAGVPVRLQATQTGELDPTAVHPRAGFMILPRITAGIDLAALPGAGMTAFPQGTLLRVVIGTDSQNDIDPDRAELTPIDVSGLQFAELATIVPSAGGDRLEVSARKTKVDADLGPLAAKARSAARAALRQDELPDERKVALEINIDCTISMLGRIEDGSVRAAVDLLVGISTVAGQGAPRINLVGRESKSLAPAAPMDVAERLQEELDRMLLGVGFKSDRPRSGAPTDRQWVYTITDAVPADYASAVAADQGHARHHLVILAPAISGQLPPGCAGTQVLVPPPATSATEALIATPTELSRVVNSMLAGVSVASETSGAPR